MKRIRGVVLLVAAILCGNAAAAVSPKEKTLGQSGIWQVVAVNDPFAEKSSGCRIQSRTVGEEGGRRKEARIRIDVNESTVFVDSNINLKRVIMAGRHIIQERNSGIQYNPERFNPDNILYHTFRIDDGYILEQSVQDPDFGEWAVHTDIKDFDRAINNLSNGKMLFYKWELENGSQVFEYDLAGFKEMLQLYKQKCP
ncbi:MAG: hypothetical protein V7677_14215 [Motiliproteus sp.]